MSFSMLFYPTSLIFHIARVMRGALADIIAGRYTAVENGMAFDEYENIVGLLQWSH